MTRRKRITLPGKEGAAADPAPTDEDGCAAGIPFRLLIDAMPQIVWLMQPDGRHTYVNQRWLDYCGMLLEESLGHGWMALVHPDDRSRVRIFWELACAGNQPCETDYRLRRADGAYRWMLGRAVAQLDAAGRAALWIGTLTDIDALKQDQALLEKNISMNRIAGRVAQLGGWTIDLPERTLTWSDENCLIHDVPPGYVPTLDEGIGYFLPEHRHLVARHVQDCAQHGIPYEFVLPKRTATGRRIWVRSIGEAVRDDSGKIIRLQGAFQDISAQKMAEDRLRSLEVQLITTLESITDGFCLVDKDWNFTFFNGQAERMLRRSRENILGKNLWQEYPEAVGTWTEHELHAAMKEQRTTRFETFYLPLKTWFHFNVYPMEAGLAIYFQDITERRQQQAQILSLNSELEERVLLRTAQLATANKELESFAYSVSHDLRSPLNTIHAFSQLLLKIEGDRVSEKGRHYLARIGVGVKQMGDLIEGLLTLAHLSREQLNTEHVDLSSLIRQIGQACQAREPQRQAQLQVQDGLKAHGDARLLSTVFQNLLGNAWKFTSRESLARIEVGSQADVDGDTVFFVKDNGAGFDMAFAHKLFGTFERLHSPGDFAGTGIGLATVKRIIERHGGRVWAQSQLNEGASFFFTLQPQAVPAKPASPQADAP